MADILALPCRVDPDGAQRLAEALAVMMDQGHDPGPREAQIRSFGLSIDTLVKALRVELEKLGLAKDLDVLIDRLEQLASLARSYQADEPGWPSPEREAASGSGLIASPDSFFMPLSGMSSWASFC